MVGWCVWGGEGGRERGKGGRVISGQVVLDCMRKAEQVMTIKPASRQCSTMVSASFPDSRSLPWLPLVP